tara:strand:+ start:2402 stop:3445 length:1044 start_codon:yes stop_codon:yes gene_type:complete
MIISLLEKEIPFIDVRAPVEFEQGALPSSKNLPILTNVEREQVGKVYKSSGGNAATGLGFSLVNDETKYERVESWIKFISKNPNTHLYCARGGKRSEIAVKWLKEKGVDIPRISGGFKAIRNCCIEILNQASVDTKDWTIIAGKTGSNKTGLISSVKNAIDLEGLANHRGSAFGGHLTPQPTPINFENSLAIKYLQISTQRIFFEDESRTIGKLVIPENIYKRMTNSKIALVDESIEFRINQIYQEYVENAMINETELELYNKLKTQLSKISKRLGSKNFNAIGELMQKAFISKSKNAHFQWIEQLLVNYYDKMYEYQMSKKLDRCIFSGSWNEVKSFMLQNKDNHL